MVADITEAVTDTKTVFQNICSFFPRATFLQFFKSVYLFVEQTCFSRRCYYVLRTDTNSPGRFIKQNVFFQDGLYLFVKQTLLSHKTDINFPKNPYLVLEPIHISTFSRRLLYYVLYLKQIGIFQEGTLFSYRNLLIGPHRLIGLSDCFRYNYIIYTS